MHHAAWEVATIAEPYANYYVASQDYESAEAGLQ